MCILYTDFKFTVSFFQLIITQNIINHQETLSSQMLSGVRTSPPEFTWTAGESTEILDTKLLSIL